MATRRKPPLAALLQQAGYDLDTEDFSAERLAGIRQLVEKAYAGAESAAVELIRVHRELVHAREQCARAAAAAEGNGQLLQQLLTGPAVLSRLERVVTDDDGTLRAVSRHNGQTRELRVHPEIDPDSLRRLAPWHYVRIHADESVVIGVCDDDELFDAAHGDVAEFRGYLDRDRGLARICRDGRGEEIVRLAPTLRDAVLTPPVKLVLQRDGERWALAAIPADTQQSRFEVPVESIETRFEDLAGLDSVMRPFYEDILLRVIHPKLRETFGLKPMSGALVYSYKPGMGKTALMRALARELRELGEKLGFDVALYIVKPNELKSMWHGADAKLVREDLCGSIIARQRAQRGKPLFQLVVLDEIDSLGRRAGGNDGSQVTSPAHNDAVQALLAEMDGMVQQGTATNGDGLPPPAHVLWVGLTNRPDMLDDALKRPGRFGLSIEIPNTTKDGAEGILAVHARGESVPWYTGGAPVTNLGEDEIRAQFLRPAIARVFDHVVLRCQTDTRKPIDVTAGEVLSGAHYEAAIHGAKRLAALRALCEEGVAAIGFEDVLSSLADQAISAAKQMQADRQMLVRQLQISARITRVDAVPREELDAQEFTRN